MSIDHPCAAALVTFLTVPLIPFTTDYALLSTPTIVLSFPKLVGWP